MPSITDINARAQTLYATGRYSRAQAMGEAAKQLAREQDKRDAANREKPEAKPIQN
jgi:hypothetical protein